MARILLPALIVLSVPILFAAGCGGDNRTESATSTSPAAATAEPTETEVPTWTPAPPLPEVSDVTLEPAAPAAGYGLYLGDARTGQEFRVETAPGPLLYDYSWISPTQLVLFAWTQSDSNYYLLDLDAKTLRRLPVSAKDGDESFSNVSGLMTSSGPNGSLIISKVADGSEFARIPNGPISSTNDPAYLSWAPDDKHLFYRSANSADGWIASVEASPVAIPVNTLGESTSVNWTADGSAVVVANDNGIYSIDATSGETKSLYAFPPGLQIQGDSLMVSPDGKYGLVMYGRANDTGFHRDAVVVPLDGRTKGFSITSIETLDIGWSTSDDTLGVIADRCTPNDRLLLVNADGSVQTTIEGADHMPRFSSDGTLLAYEGSDPNDRSARPRGGVVVRSASGSGGIVSFIRDFFDDSSWSPDGRWIADSYGDWPAPYTDSCVGGLPKTEIKPFP